MQNNLKLLLIRHVSGAGSSTFAQFLVQNYKAIHFEADFWMVNEKGEYQFKPEKLGFCHNMCRIKTEQAMIDKNPLVIVTNTFTTFSEVNPYLTLAEKYGYSVTSLAIEKLHSNENTHGVPEFKLDEQERKLRANLKLR